MPRRSVPAEPPADLITITEAADRARVSANTIRNWTASGLIQAWRVGPKNLRVSAADVDAVIKPVPAAVRRSA